LSVLKEKYAKKADFHKNNDKALNISAKLVLSNY
jgi:hypothetical protein